MPPMNCACTACPTLPRVYENFATDAFASPLPEIYMPVLCPTKLGMFPEKMVGTGFWVTLKLVHQTLTVEIGCAYIYIYSIY